jgi:hypothetical protein
MLGWLGNARHRPPSQAGRQDSTAEVAEKSLFPEASRWPRGPARPGPAPRDAQQFLLRDLRASAVESCFGLLISSGAAGARRQLVPRPWVRGVARSMVQSGFSYGAAIELCAAQERHAINSLIFARIRTISRDSVRGIWEKKRRPVRQWRNGPSLGRKRQSHGR